MAKRTTKTTGTPSKTSMVQLGNIANLYKFPAVIKESKQGTKIKTITAADVSEEGLITKAEKEMTFAKSIMDKVEKYYLQPNDVILTVTGIIGKVAIVDESLKGKCISSSTLIVIRFNEEKTKKDDAITLLMYFRSDAGQKALQKMITGKSMKIINIGTVSKMKVPEPTPEIKKIAKADFAKIQKHFQKIEETKKAIDELFKSFLK